MDVFLTDQEIEALIAEEKRIDVPISQFTSRFKGKRGHREYELEIERPATALQRQKPLPLEQVGKRDGILRFSHSYGVRALSTRRHERGALCRSNRPVR